MANTVNDRSKFFEEYKYTDEIPRLAVAGDGMDKNGKSHWSFMTTPDPIMVVTNDPGSETILKKAYKKGRKIAGVMRLEYETPDSKVVSKGDVDKEQQRLWNRAWTRYTEGMEELAGNRKDGIRTVIVDTHSAIYELAQLAKFGKLRGNKENQNLWAEINSEMHKAFWDLYKNRPDLNIVLLHKLKKEYAATSTGKDAWTNRYERQSNRDVGFWVDISLRFGWDKSQRCFYTEIQDGQPIRFNPGGGVTPEDNPLIGKRWSGADSTFWALAMDVFPHTMLTPEIWGQ
jgi:hypothetical protein